THRSSSARCRVETPPPCPQSLGWGRIARFDVSDPGAAAAAGRGVDRARAYRSAPAVALAALARNDRRHRPARLHAVVVALGDSSRPVFVAVPPGAPHRPRFRTDPRACLSFWRGGAGDPLVSG